VTYVPDGAVQLAPRAWLPASTEQTWTEHPEYLDDSGNLVASIGGLLVEHGDRALLVDAGFGPRSAPAEPGNPHGAIYGGALLDNLAELGRRPDEIEAVAITHLHLDHVGWAAHPARAATDQRSPTPSTGSPSRSGRGATSPRPPAPAPSSWRRWLPGCAPRPTVRRSFPGCGCWPPPGTPWGTRAM